MQLTVYGATGRIGEQVVRQALDTGHNVTAVVRDPTHLNLHHPALEIITVPGLTNPEILRPTLEGSHAAISAVGQRGRNDGPVASTATHAILHAMHTNGVRRLVAVSAVPVGPVPTGESLLNRRIILPLISTFAREVYADLATMEDEIAHSTTDWTVVRPPKLNNKPLTGKYRTSVGANVPRGYSISRADVAHAMLQMLNDPATFRQPVGIAY
jgi:putative NADH-flavin reductase